MRKEDFIVGKWYLSSEWSSFKAVKFFKFSNDGYFCYSERISTNCKQHEFIESRTTNDNKKWNTFREVPISEIQHLLPVEHPDLTVEFYVKCKYKNTPSLHSKQKKIPQIVNKIYKIVESSYPEKGVKLLCYVSDCGVVFYANSTSSSTKEEYDKQERLALKLNFVNDFPDEGCYFDDDNILLNFLIKNNYTPHSGHSKKSKINEYLKWNKFQYWYINNPSTLVKNYTTQQINQLINYNTNQNERNTLQPVETENSRTNHIGTVAIRRGRQQITVGNRPYGNQTIVKIGRTEINSIKICKNIVQSANY
jgi:hypothetical protein